MGVIKKEADRLIITLKPEEILSQRVYLFGEHGLMPTSMTIADAIRYYAHIQANKHAEQYMNGQYKTAEVSFVNGEYKVTYYENPPRRPKNVPNEKRVHRDNK